MRNMIPSKTISPVNANALIAYARLEKSFFEATKLAVKLYDNQKRRHTGVKYVSHPLTVASLMLDIAAPVNVMVASVLAEALSRTTLKEATLRAQFGDEVAELVRAVTLPKAEDGQREEAFAQHLATLAAAGPQAQTLKLAEMLDHLCAIPAKELTAEYAFIDECARTLAVLSLGNAELARRVEAAIRRARS